MMVFRNFFAVVVVIACIPVWPLLPQSRTPNAIYQQASDDIERGNLSQAERLLRPQALKHPHDIQALAMLAIVLDGEKRYSEAETYYKKAVQIDPRSSSLLNNLGNHYLAIHDLAKAQQTYRRVVALSPHHPNANLQLAAMAVAAKDGKAALQYLGNLPPGTATQPDVGMLRVRALHLAGDDAAANRSLHQILIANGNNPRIAFSAGMIFVDWKRYADAESALSQALAADPSNFDILYNLGVAAIHARDFRRAHAVLQVALQQKPHDPDTLFQLARAETAQAEAAEALPLLVEAHQSAPQRADILLLMAQDSETLGFYGDSATAFQEYLKMRPQDEVARREWGFVLVRTPQVDEGIRALKGYVEKHPHDARGLYELGVAETIRNRNLALKYLNQALAADPAMAEARYARAVLNYEGDQGQKALDDLNRILPLEPNNSSLLDLAGEVYLELNRPADALKALSAALRLDPNSRQILIHYARALERDGQTQQAMAVLQKFQKIPPSSPRPYSGLFKYLSLPVAKQQQQYVANLERNSQMNPQDMILRYRLGRAYLLQGKISEAKQSFAVVLESSSDARLLGKCGAALVSAGDYLEARPFLEKAVEADPGNTGARLDLAIAQFHSAGAQQALSILDGTPLNARQGDYYLLRAQILDAKGKPAEAAQDLNRGLAAQPTRPDLYFAGVLFLVKHGQLNQAISFLQKAVESLPDSPQLLLAETITYGLAQQFEAAKKVLSEIETKWPEWDEPYLIHGFILVGQAKMPEAKPLLETAIALGARDPLAYYNLALVDMESFPPQVEEAKKAIEKALQADPNDAYIQSLAGKIAYEQKDYPASIEHLSEAIRLWPNMVEAHQTLSAAYRALGEKDKSVAELKEVLHIKQQIRAPDQAPPSPIENLLFSVPSALPPAIPSGLQSKGLPKAP